MMKFSALVIALVLAPGLQSAVVSRDEISNYPGVIEFLPVVRPLPIEPEIVPVVPETKPLPIEANPCEACFSYMATLIDQLTETVEPQLPEFIPEAAPSPPAVILPQPAPQLPEVELRPLPIFPEVPQVPPQIELRPLPIFPEVPQIELRPLPIFPEVPQVRPVVPALANF